MSIRVTTDSNDDDSPVTLEWCNAEHGNRYEVAMWLGPDGVPVVQIDTPSRSDDERVRVNLNDAPIWDGYPARDELPDSEFRRPS